VEYFCSLILKKRFGRSQYTVGQLGNASSVQCHIQPDYERLSQTQPASVHLESGNSISKYKSLGYRVHDRISRFCNL
jgi:hypothetical protein